MSATDNDLQVSTTERKVAFATATDAEYKLADGRVGVSSRFRDHSRPHISAALPVHTIISSPSERREGRGEQLLVTPVPRTSSGPLRLRRMRQLKLDACALSAS